MNTRKRTPAKLLLSISVLAPCAAEAAAAQAPVRQNPCAQTAPDLSEKERRRAEVGCLLAKLRDEALRREDPEQVFKVMRRLGELRAAEAVPDLISLLALKRVFDWETPENAGRTGIEETAVTPANRYPAVDALISIGKPALAPLVAVIEGREGGSTESENAVYGVFMILEARPSKASDYLRRAAGRAHSREARARLLAASKNPMLSPVQSER
jgi:hypothetical protein